MRKKNGIVSIGVLIFVLAGGFSAIAGQDIKFKPAQWEFKLRVLEGLREGAAEPAKVVTSSYLKYMLTADFQSKEEADDEKQVKKIFNLKDVKLLTEANLNWKKGDPEKASHSFRLDGKTYLVQVSGGSVEIKPEFKMSQRFGIEVSEQDGVTKASLLDTEFTFPNMKHIAVFGFEDTQGRPYFISLRQTKMFAGGGAEGGGIGMVAGGVEGGVAGGVEGGVTGGVEGGVAGGIVGGVQSEEMEKKRQEFRKDAVPCKGDIKPPKLIKKVEPAYPEEARKNGVQGVVILEAKVDERGRVMDAMILRSIPELDQAAIDAVRQWVYEPLLIDGKPTKVLFTVTVRFQLGEKDIEKFAEGAVKVTDTIPPPRLIKKVDPVYSTIASQAGVEGVVILEARTDVNGRVKNVRVLRSVPLLDQAAIDAVRQWIYEPLIIDGQPKEAIFTTTVRFTLEDKEEKGQAGGTATGDVLVPKLIKRVDPVYPEAARRAGVQGLILLEATTDEKGNVAAIRVLKSIPELDQAAIDALKKWKYEPFIIEGKPKGVVFTVTIKFALR